MAVNCRYCPALSVVLDDLADNLLAMIDPERATEPERGPTTSAGSEQQLELARIFHDVRAGRGAVVTLHWQMQAALSRRVVTDASLMPLSRDAADHQGRFRTGSAGRLSQGDMVDLSSTCWAAASC